MEQHEFLFITRKRKYLQDLKQIYQDFSLPEAAFVQMDSISITDDYFSHHSPQLIFIDSDFQNKDIHHLLLDLQMSGFQGWENNIVLLIERDSQSVEQLRQTLAVGIQKVLFYPFAYEECSSLFLRPGEPEEKQTETKQTELYLARSLRSLRNAFINRFLESDFFLDLDLQTLNTQYHMNLSEGLFRFVIIKFPVLASESEKMQHRMMQDDLVHNIRQVFDPICLEIVPFIRDSNTIFLILNYSSSRKLEKHFHRLAGLTEETARQYYDARLPYTVGIGNAVSNIRELHYAFQTAQYALRCQLLYGFNQTYLYGAQRFTPPRAGEKEYEKWFSEIDGFTKFMDKQSIFNHIKKIFASFSSRTDPSFISDICMRLARTVIASMQKTTRMDEQDTNLAPITRYLDTNNSLNGLRSALCQWVSMLLDRYKDALIHPLHRSIYETMYYIDQNYSSHLTLQNLSEKVHLSPSYFCHLFKENTGMSFMDYLTNVRLDHAKEYLADTDYSVAHISELVGYRDSRYFSRIFSKKTGISPSDFRRQKRPSR